MHRTRHRKSRKPKDVCVRACVRVRVRVRVRVCVCEREREREAAWEWLELLVKKPGILRRFGQPK